MLLVVWPLVGAAIGAAAAQRNGFGLAGGIIGGLLLGPLAVLLFLVSDRGRQKCPFCAEWMKTEATVCPHCARDVRPRAVYEARKAQAASKRPTM